ncbi:MAG: arginine repressor [Acidobacteria bacterium]|nr:MAG: arginine repressor [Acidobacteriota bacterium]
MKTYRQSAILDLVSRHAVRSQDMLRRQLAVRGIKATQATISRDIKELGLVKRAADGAYRTAPAETRLPAVTADRVRRAVVEHLRRVDRVQQLLVLKTEPGHAQPLAFALDQAAWPEVVGTLAGDDTVLVVTRVERSARTIERRLGGWAKG